MYTSTVVSVCRLLTYDPKRRIDARTAMDHIWYSESPKPVDPSMFPTWPARSEQVGRRHVLSPRPPSGGKAFAKMMVGGVAICNMLIQLSATVWRMCSDEESGSVVRVIGNVRQKCYVVVGYTDTVAWNANWLC